MKQSIRLITVTAMLIALLVIIQFTLAPFGQLMVGPFVNLILMLAAMYLNWRAGLLIGFVSPFIAFLLNIGTTFFVLVPWIAMGNVLLVATIVLVQRLLQFRVPHATIRITAALVLGVFVKVGFYAVGIVGFLIPTLSIPPAAANVLSYSFSWMQLYTGLIAIVTVFPVRLLLSPALRRYSHD